MCLPLTLLTLLLIGFTAKIEGGLVSDYCFSIGQPCPSFVDLPRDILDMTNPLALLLNLPQDVLNKINEMRLESDKMPMFDILVHISEYHKGLNAYKKAGFGDPKKIDFLQYVDEASLVCKALARMWNIKNYRGNFKDTTPVLIEGKLLDFMEAPKVDCMLYLAFGETHFDVIPVWHEGEFTYFFLATKEGKILDMIASSKRGQRADKTTWQKERTIHLLNGVDTTWSQNQEHQKARLFLTGGFEESDFYCKKSAFEEVKKEKKIEKKDEKDEKGFDTSMTESSSKKREEEPLTREKDVDKKKGFWQMLLLMIDEISDMIKNKVKDKFRKADDSERKENNKQRVESSRKIKGKDKLLAGNSSTDEEADTIQKVRAEELSREMSKLKLFAEDIMRKDLDINGDEDILKKKKRKFPKKVSLMEEGTKHLSVCEDSRKSLKGKEKLFPEDFTNSRMDVDAFLKKKEDKTSKLLDVDSLVKKDKHKSGPDESRKNHAHGTKSKKENKGKHASTEDVSQKKRKEKHASSKRHGLKKIEEGGSMLATDSIRKAKKEEKKNERSNETDST